MVLERWAAGQRLVRERWAELHIQWWWLVGAAAVLAGAGGVGGGEAAGCVLHPGGVDAL